MGRKHGAGFWRSRIRSAPSVPRGLALLAATSLLALSTVASASPAGAQIPPVAGAQKPDLGGLTPRLDALARAHDGGAGSPQFQAVPGLPVNRPGGLQRLDDSRLIVDVRMDDIGDAAQSRLRDAGAEVLAVGDPSFHTLTAAVADADLRRLSRVAGVRHVEEALAPEHLACNPVDSEGDTQLRAASARSNSGFDGSGVKVGIISDSFDRAPAGAATNAAGDVAAGELPGAGNPCGRTTPVTVVDDGRPAPVVDEGRAMAELIHDIAPGAELTFSQSGISETSFANAIANMVNGGAKVIVDDVKFLAEPFYQDGPVAVAVNNARASGVSYFSSAGNQNITLGGADVGSYEALAYRPTACPTLPYAYLDCHSFEPSGAVDRTIEMQVPNGADLELNLQWAQPRGGVTTDLDIWILDPDNGFSVLDSSHSANTGPNGSQRPFEFASWHNGTGASKLVSVVVGRFQGPAVRFKIIHTGHSRITGIEYSTTTGTDVFGPTIFGHNGGASTFSVGAVRYDTTSAAEPYSSHGPVTLLFQPVPSTVALASPQVLAKPDFVATDCAQTSFFPPGSAAPHRFCGTSAASPHAAAVAALALNARPSLTPAQLGSTLQNTARAVGSSPATVVGAGLLDANAAVGSLSTNQAPAFTSPAGTTFTVGVAGTFTVTVTGTPSPSVSMSGTPPSGVTFNGGTRTLSGTPAAGTAGTYNLTLTAGNGVAPTATQSFTLTVAGGDGDFTPLTPARILDTRTSVGGHQAKLGTAEVANVVVTGVGGVPAGGVDSVVLNVTATGASANTFLTLFPAGQARPNASNLNVVPGQDVPNLVVAKVGTNGSVAVYNNAGVVDAIFDVVGWYRPSSSCFTSVTPARILDTRTSTKVGPGQSRDVQVTGAGGVPASNVGAVVLNVTATAGNANTFLTVFPAGQVRPNASNLNVVPGQDVPNLVVAKVGANGNVTVFNNQGSVDVIFDVVGWHPANASCFTSLTPARILDTRSTTQVGPGESRDVHVVGTGGVPGGGVGAVVMNVTATAGNANTFLTVFPAGQVRPNASNLNVVPGQDVPNLVVAKVGANGNVTVFNNQGSVDVIFDVVGWFA